MKNIPTALPHSDTISFAQQELFSNEEIALSPGYLTYLPLPYRTIPRHRNLPLPFERVAGGWRLVVTSAPNDAPAALNGRRAGIPRNERNQRQGFAGPRREPHGGTEARTRPGGGQV